MRRPLNRPAAAPSLLQQCGTRFAYRQIRPRTAWAGCPARSTWRSQRRRRTTVAPGHSGQAQSPAIIAGHELWDRVETTSDGRGRLQMWRLPCAAGSSKPGARTHAVGADRLWRSSERRAAGVDGTSDAVVDMARITGHADVGQAMASEQPRDGAQRAALFAGRAVVEGRAAAVPHQIDEAIRGACGQSPRGGSCQRRRGPARACPAAWWGLCGVVRRASAASRTATPASRRVRRRSDALGLRACCGSAPFSPSAWSRSRQRVQQQPGIALATSAARVRRDGECVNQTGLL